MSDNQLPDNIKEKVVLIERGIREAEDLISRLSLITKTLKWQVSALKADQEPPKEKITDWKAEVDSWFKGRGGYD